MLDVAGNKGLLLPRMTTQQRDAISSPAEGLLIYNISMKCFQFWEYGTWQSFGCATPCTVGAQVGGGVVFYVGGGKCYVAATIDQLIPPFGGSVWWNGANTTTGANGTAIGTGPTNTTLIVNSQGPGNYAAKICDSLTLNGYTDWIFPSQGEMEQMYIQKSIIGGFSGNFSGYYWSSTEIAPNLAYSKSFLNGNVTYFTKNATANLRCIRIYNQ